MGYASVADHWMWFDAWPGVKALDNMDRPIRITYGDDSPMTQEELAQFVDVYDKYGIALEWQQGDIAIMCNYRWAHGRPVYEVKRESWVLYWAVCLIDKDREMISFELIL